jgi:hypothetical protein
MHICGKAVDAAKAGLLARARALGHECTSAPDLRVLADGVALCAHVRGATWRLRVPPAACVLRIASRRWVPAHMDPGQNDTRALGVALRNLRVDGIKLPLDDPRLSSGWHAVEPGDKCTGPYRWTDGDAGLCLAGAHGLAFDVVMAGTYWRLPVGSGRGRRKRAEHLVDLALGGRVDADGRAADEGGADDAEADEELLVDMV